MLGEGHATEDPGVCLEVSEPAMQEEDHRELVRWIGSAGRTEDEVVLGLAGRIEQIAIRQRHGGRKLPELLVLVHLLVDAPEMLDDAAGACPVDEWVEQRQDP